MAKKKMFGEDKKGNRVLNKKTQKEEPLKSGSVIVEPYVHPRFKRKVWVFSSELTALMAKSLVDFSPYVVPANLSLCLEKFNNEIVKTFVFNEHDMAEVSLLNLTSVLKKIVLNIPEFKVLEEPKVKGFNHHSNTLNRNPDYDYISLEPLANNVTVLLAQREDAECWLDSTNGNNDGGK